MLESDQLEFGNRRCSVAFQQVDQGHHLVDILLVSNHHQATIRQDLDFHLAPQPAQNRLGWRKRLVRIRRISRIGFHRRWTWLGIGFGFQRIPRRLLAGRFLIFSVLQQTATDHLGRCQCGGHQVTDHRAHLRCHRFGILL